MWRKGHFASCRETNPDVSVVHPVPSLLFRMSYTVNKTKQNSTNYHVGRGGKVSELYSGGALFESEGFCGFIQPHQANAGIVNSFR
jgi:hypothetical protein